MNVAVRGATDLGLKRSQNEDSHAWWIPEQPADHERGVLLVVADGMGGARAGEVASRLAVETVVRAYREAVGKTPLESLHGSIDLANRVIHQHSLAHPELKGMGTTCTAAVLRNAEVYVAHVGDSRAYLLRDGRIRQLTRDHSLVAHLVQSRQLTPEEARTDPRRNVVMRSVGINEPVEIDAERVEERMEDGDTLLLCTDGLHGLVRDDELLAHASGPDLDHACERLIALAKERGGHDNITVILARLSPAADRGDSTAGRDRTHADPDAPRSWS